MAEQATGNILGHRGREMAKSSEIIVMDILEFIQLEGGHPTMWYVGVTDDAQGTLFDEHGVHYQNDAWIYRMASSEIEAQRVEEYFLEYGLDGGKGGKRPDSRMVYVYKKSIGTKRSPRDKFAESNSNTNKTKVSQTWAGKTKFTYYGSVTEGTTIPLYGNNRVFISALNYDSLLLCFRGCIVDLGTSFNPSKGSIGGWLRSHVTKTKIASHVGAILIAEGYAERVGKSGIKIF
jgi:hypothetical protein